MYVRALSLKLLQLPRVQILTDEAQQPVSALQAQGVCVCVCVYLGIYIQDQSGKPQKHILNFSVSIQNKFLKSALRDIRRRVQQLEQHAHTDPG